MIKVTKFGGSSVANAAQFKKVRKIMCDEKDVNQMIRKMMLTAIALGAGVTAYLLLKNRDSAKKDEDDSDTEVNFIKISDDEGDDEDEDDKPEPAKQPEAEPEVKPEPEKEPEPEQPAEEEKPVDIPVMITTVLTATTKPLDMTLGIEDLLKPFEKIHESGQCIRRKTIR